MDKIEIIEAACPTCSPQEEVAHTVIKDKLIKCEACGFIHRLPHEKRKTVTLRVIVSRQSQSWPQEITVDDDEVLHVGDEFVVEADDEISGVRVQSLELKTSGRAEKAKAKDIRTVWARAIDEVVVKIAIQTSKGVTESVDYKVNGDFEFTVGDIMKIQGKEVSIHSIKVRDGGSYDRVGKSIKAKNIKRIYTRILAESRFKPKEESQFKPRATGEGSRSRTVGSPRKSKKSG